MYSRARLRKLPPFSNHKTKILIDDKRVDNSHRCTCLELSKKPKIVLGNNSPNKKTKHIRQSKHKHNQQSISVKKSKYAKEVKYSKEHNNFDNYPKPIFSEKIEDLTILSYKNNDKTHRRTKLDLTELLLNLIFLLKILKINIQVDLQQNHSKPSSATRDNLSILNQLITDNHNQILIIHNIHDLPVSYIIEGREKKIIALDVDSNEKSIFHLTLPDTEYITSLVTTKTYLTAIYELENFLRSCLPSKYHIQKISNFIKNSIDSVVNLIAILLYQIEKDGEKGYVSPEVRNTAIELFNYLINNPNLIIYDNNCTQITDKYYGNVTNNCRFYGLQLYDFNGHLVKIGISNFHGEIYNQCYPLDLLTLKSTLYITGNTDHLAYFVSFSNSLSQLKEYFTFLKHLISDL